MAINLKRSVLLSLFIVCVYLPVNAQMIDGRQSTASTGFVYTHWTLESDAEETSLGQVWIPVSGFLAIQENLEARYYLAGSANDFEINRIEYKLEGIGDVRLELTRSFAENQFFISGGMNLPTGKTKLAFNKDQAIIETLSQSFLIFPMRRFGEGVGLNGTIGFAKNWETSVIGLGASFDYIGKYTPYEDRGEYNPGDIFTVQTGFSTRGDRFAFALGADYMLYATDKLDGKKVFEQGEQVVFSTMYIFDNSKFRINPNFRYTFRGRNTRFETNSEVIRDRLKLYGNELEVGLEFRKYIRSGWSMGPLVSFLYIENNEEDFGDSNVFTAGAQITKIFANNVRFGSWFKIYNGETDGGNIDLLGYQISASLTAVL